MSRGKEQEYIVIRGMGSVSGLGGTPEEVQASYSSGKKAFTTLPHLGSQVPVAPLSPAAEELLSSLLQENPVYGSLDRSVHLAILASRQALAQAGWQSEPSCAIGINIGSSRGATGLFEQFHAHFLENSSQRLPPGVSPSTTLGNVASWVAHDLQATGPLISHSVTCSTALQAFANGVAWLKAGMAKRFLVGGTEAPLTPFTIAQMKSIGIYSKFAADDSPCRPLNQESNTFVLGEGAAVFALERMTLPEMAAVGLSEIVVVEAVGLGYERSPSKTGISPEGAHFQLAMREALAQAALMPADVGAIVLHAPGTKAGDAAEMQAIQQIFSDVSPAFYSNKAQIGHTLGASGALSAEMAISALLGKNLTQYPSASRRTDLSSNFMPSSIMVNAAGFGGNAACALFRLLRTA
ncbi:beta-ketoacyl synthase N-terminal-like domain-containing protein [Rufibacter glacialis]|uniref:Beta-ketoacyl synthase N-terminal-like domain-containing protein n=1 Tax=Rufibacter glacialis TaxID=1259555 RepID=A0A5M8Q9Q4_9BACT|nr:beta-ketoacyl synthase N-terminal-like domain-containing protein [Rufibacter glacialis]KAA6431674.1 beta-ketoacyl-ACP reductase [Rufibacter glacialis]GGK82526.1 beta-ketoacyl synthase [Rufibacter glacialis]